MGSAQTITAETLGHRVVMGTIGAACAAFLCWSAVQARLHGSDDGQATQGATRRSRFHFSQWCHQLEWMFTFDFGDTTYTFPFPVHSRVRHVSRGLGTVVRLLENGRTEVRFDGSAEVHRYRPVPTARKLTAVKSEDGEEAPPVPLLRWLSVILGTEPLRAGQLRAV